MRELMLFLLAAILIMYLIAFVDLLLTTKKMLSSRQGVEVLEVIGEMFVVMAPLLVGGAFLLVVFHFYTL